MIKGFAAYGKPAAARRGCGETCRIANFEGLQQPAVAGLFRPQLLLPDDAAVLDDRQLRMIMLHELAHVRRWHVAANWALAILRAIHWWNPVFWLAASRFHSLREQSCDAFAIQRLEGRPTRDYSELLLMLAQRQPWRPRWQIVLSASLLGFVSSFFRKRSLRNRIRALKRAGAKRSRWHSVAVAGLIGLTAVCGLTDAGVPEPPPERSFEWLPHAGYDWNNGIDRSEPSSGPQITRVYNIEKAVQRIAADKQWHGSAPPPLEEQVEFLLKCLEPFPVAPISQPRSSERSSETHRPAHERVAVDGVELTVTASPNAHAELVRNLRAWEQSGLGQTSLQTRFISAELDIASAIGISWRYLEAFSDERDEELPAQGKHGMPVVRAGSRR